MNCPDLAALRRAGTPRSDPAVVEHLQTCEECWLDWQIQEGARLLLDPEEKTVRDLSDPDERVLTRIAALARESDTATSWKQLVLSALLIAFAVLVFVMFRDAVVGPIPIWNAALYAGAVSLSWALYRWRRERTATADSDMEEPPEDLPVR